MRSLVVIPTYNESENIASLIPAIRAEGLTTDILVVDDSSPDGTAEVVKKLAKSDPQVHLLVRPGKQGLGKAYLAGFAWGLEKDFDVIVEMDADFSHRPEDLKKLLQVIPTVDFAMGSRWVSGGSTLNWGLGRKLLSRGGSLYARMILGYPIHDWTGGFNAWQSKVLRRIGLETIRSEGYSFQIELKYRASRLGFRGHEVPIVFADRRVGQSKMSSRIVLEALHRVWGLRARTGLGDNRGAKSREVT